MPAFTEDMPVRSEPGAGPDLEQDAEDAPVSEPSAPRSPEASGRGRVAPPARGPVRQSGASGRVQPSRQTRSRRGKK